MNRLETTDLPDSMLLPFIFGTVPGGDLVACREPIFNTIPANPVDVTVGFWERFWYWRKYQWKQKKLAGAVSTLRQKLR
jgi:hypothetical protein